MVITKGRIEFKVIFLDKVKMFNKLKISSSKFIFLLSLYLGYVLNISFFKTIFLKFPTVSFSQYLCVGLLVFVALLPILMFLNVILVKYTIKTFSILILLISSFTNYMMFKLGVHLNYEMIRNVFETNIREASEFFSFSSVLNTVILGLIPAIIVYKTKIEFNDLKTECKKRCKTIVLSVIFILIFFLIFKNFLIPFGRNNSEIKSQYNTLNYITNTIKYIRKSLKTPKEFIILDNNVKETSFENGTQVLVLVIGEAARAMNFSIYDYKKETNPLLKDINDLIAVRDVASCGTSTAYSLPCMFSAKNRQGYDKDNARYEENLLDILKKAGWNVVWYENDDGCKGVCARIETHNIVQEITNDKNDEMNDKFCFKDYCQDDALFRYLDNELKNISKSTVIVLHTMGSHGPAYYKRYPKNFEKFKPTCESVNIQNCTNDELVNTYDNTILYTDYIVSSTINMLKAHSDILSSLIYVSDHGESLGEMGLFLHGIPYSIAPKEQTTVPFVMWFSDKMQTEKNINVQCLKNKSWENISHDNLFHTVLGITRTETKLYDEKLDMMLTCKENDALK